MSYNGNVWTDPKYVNYNNSQWSANFTSNVIPPCGLPEPVNNVAAAASYIKGLTNGGGKRKFFSNKNNIYTKNFIGKEYMKHNRLKSVKNNYSLTKKRLKTRRQRRKTGGSKKKLNRKSVKKYRGGYSQYMNNVPNTSTYSLGVNSGTTYPSALANPTPYNVLSNCTNCVDNYNHYTNEGFPSVGSY